MSINTTNNQTKESSQEPYNRDNSRTIPKKIKINNVKKIKLANGDGNSDALSPVGARNILCKSSSKGMLKQLS